MLLDGDGPGHVGEVVITLEVVGPRLCGCSPFHGAGGPRGDDLVRDGVIRRVERVVLPGYAHVVDRRAGIRDVERNVRALADCELLRLVEIVLQRNVEAYWTAATIVIPRRCGCGR